MSVLESEAGQDRSETLERSEKRVRMGKGKELRVSTRHKGDLFPKPFSSNLLREANKEPYNGKKKGGGVDGSTPENGRGKELVYSAKKTVR